jgi:hypothetical protein
LRTADIAGAGKAEAEDFIEVEAVPERSEQDQTPLFSSELNQDFRAQWRNIQTGFVDEPRASVERADELVAQVMQRLAQSFSDQRKELEKQWDASDEISTEELRLALRRYRSFFERLLSI